MTRFPKTLAAAAVAAGVMGAAAAAQASIVDWTYTVGNTVEGSGQMTLGGPNPAFGDTVTAITGTIFGQSITSLVNNPNAPFDYNNGSWDYDNNLDPTTPAVDYYGILFNTTAGEINLYCASCSGYENGGSATQSYSYNNNAYITSGTLGVSVPEPATWALMIGGLGLTGFALRRRAAKALAV